MYLSLSLSLSHTHTHTHTHTRACQVVLVGKKLTTRSGNRAIRVWSLGQEDPLEEGMETHSSILAWTGIPMTEEPGRLQSIGGQRVWHDWSDLAHTQAHMHMYISCRVCETYWKGNREEGDIKVLVWHLKHRAGWDHLKQEHSEKIKIVFQDSNIWSEMKELKFSCSVMSNSLQPRGL